MLFAWLTFHAGLCHLLSLYPYQHTLRNIRRYICNFILGRPHHTSVDLLWIRRRGEA
ncbi:hypothetical protein Mp_5g24240 [Marchantia polymorpha subsp. ruderalis]|uniref:Uncharacterized protein n=2 Tax=Marchantia polymorpha TaxID=3197 RepID=A0AAF6BLR5_MARPO|nr:hypothetical protein Mp_5g24240 [Marchantia polymorpha subsp. ruderalis]